MDDLRQTSDEDFHQSVFPQLQVLEKIRQVKFKSYEFRKRVAMMISPVIFPGCGFIDYWLLRVQSGSDDSAAGLTFLVGGILWWWITEPKRQYAKSYKVEILPKVAALFGDLRYNASGQIAMASMQDMRIVPGHDRYKTDDYFTGAYRGAQIEFSEIELEEKRKSGKSTQYVTVFKGLAILIRLPNDRFAGHTVLMGNSAALMQWFKKKSLGLQRADLVDPAFEKQFDVYTNDQVEARYLIHPVMIEKIKAIRESYEADAVMVAYMDRRLLLLLRSKKNHFEPADIAIPATDPASVISMKHEVQQVMNLIDQMEQYDKSVAHAGDAPLSSAAGHGILENS